MTSQGRYSYRPLRPREIRLLHLHPGESQASIRLSLVHVHLQDDLAFEALSYTWGDATDQLPITCDGLEDVLDVTKNCELALRTLRYKDSVRILWIDAICVDQRNVDERNSQILLMPDIYSRADPVLAFLGEASDDSDIGMDFISEDSRLIGQENRPSIGPAERKSFNNILKRAYFERVWILQEILLAKEICVILGDKTVGWDEFSRTVWYLDANFKLQLKEAYRQRLPAAMFWRDKSAVNRPQTLLQFLDQTRNCKATDPRDKVYALLAMTPERSETDLIPDYRRSPHDVFWSVARFMLTCDGDLDVLTHCLCTASAYDLPSWVPDWSVHRVSKTLIPPSISSEAYVADGHRSAKISFESGGKTLVLEGKVIDLISRIGPSYVKGHESTATLREWEAIALSSSHDTTDLIETLTAYPGYDIFNPFARFYSAWRASIFHGKATEFDNAGSAAMIQQFVDEKCHGRRFFSTKLGHIGIGPVEMQLHHKVAALLGGRVLFVLKCLDGDQYKLVGECYVHGLMKGEAFNGDEDETDVFKIL